MRIVWIDRQVWLSFSYPGLHKRPPSVSVQEQRLLNSWISLSYCSWGPHIKMNWWMPTSAYHVTPIVVLSKVSNADNIMYMLLICFEFNKAPQAKVYSMGLIFFRKKKINWNRSQQWSLNTCHILNVLYITQASLLVFLLKHNVLIKFINNLKLLDYTF